MSDYRVEIVDTSQSDGRKEVSRSEHRQSDYGPDDLLRSRRRYWHLIVILYSDGTTEKIRTRIA